ncbi:MAG: cadherin-like domain-containing protein [Gemmatimonadetes bacterium]|nr:cadherin-like domain-containing protein [Gemmatimonadota bacterium]
MFRFRYITLALVALALVGCRDTSAPVLNSGEGLASFVISDAASGGTPGFYFLPPMVPAPSYSGTFDSNLTPVVKVCQLPACTTVIKTFNGGTKNEALTVDLAGESYRALWNTKNNPRGLQNGKDKYRLEVYVGEERLGYADLWFVSNAKQRKDVTSGYVGVVNGGTLNIKFRIETGVIEGAPNAEDDAYATAGNTTLNVAAPGVLANDDLGDPPAVLTHFGGGSLGGSVTSNAAGSTATFGTGGSLQVNADGSFSYTPSTGFEGAFTFQYRIANSVSSDVALVTITVGGSATAPEAKDDAFTVQVGQPLTGDLREDNGSGADALGVPTATVISFGGGSLGGAVTDNGTTPPANSVTLAGGTLTVDAAGTFSLTGTTLTGTVTFLYRLENAAGHSDATVSITITAGPTPPTAVDDGPAANSAPNDAFHTAFNTTLNTATHSTSSLLANDDLGSPVASLTRFGGGTLGGTVESNAAGSTASNDGHSLTVNSDGSFVYTPKTGFTGNFTFQYRITNSAGSSDATVTIAVGARPVANNDTYAHTLVGNVSINTATGTAYSVLTNDAGDALTIALVAGSESNGEVTLNADGTFTFNPVAGFRNGNGSFRYTVANGFGTSAEGTVTIPVGTQVIWFINNGAAECTTLAAGCGRLSHPFSTLAALQAINNGMGNNPADNHHIFLYESATDYTGGVTLRNGQRLIGQDATATLAALSEVTLPSHSPALPAMNTGAPATTIANGSGHGVTLGQNNRVHGLTVGNTSGVGISGSSFGTLTAGDVSITGTGQALSLTTGTLAGTGVSSISSSSGTNNISLTGVQTSGTYALGSGALTGASSHAFVVSGQNGSFSYSGSINTSGGKQVSIASKTGGTVSLSGAIGGIGTGIELSSNTGATINFTGALTLSTGANNAFSATGGGAVTATAAGSTLTSTTGIALRVENTTIGASGLTFRSISANGAANGIVLNNTGTSGGLTVSGTGTAGSGGSILNTVGGDGAVAGNGIYLNTVTGVSLDRMILSGHQNHGIYGTGVNGLSLTNSTVQNNGNNSGGAGEGGIYLYETKGTGTFSGLTVTQHNAGNGLLLYNSTAGTLTANVTGSTYSNSENDGILVEAHNTANMTLNISTTNFSANKGDHVQVAPNNAAVVNATITGGTFSGGHPLALGQGITMRAGASYSGTFTYDINGININSSISYSINTGFGSTSSTGLVRGKIRNNTIGTGGVALSGSAQGSCILAETNGPGTGTHTVSITSNTIRSCFDRGIEMFGSRDGSNNLNATVTGNNINDLSGAFSRHAIHIESGSSLANESGTVCADIANNTMTAATAVDEMRVRARSNTTWRFPGYMGSTTDVAALTTYLQGRNAAGGTASVTRDGGTTFNNTNPAGSACPTPP